MKPLTEEQLRQRAVARGAQVQLDGRSFNASMSRGKVAQRLPEPVQAPEPEPAPQPIQIDTSALVDAADAVRAGQESLAKVASEIADGHARTVDAIKQVLMTSTAKPKTSWSFHIERDGDGRISDVIAKPIVEGN